MLLAPAIAERSTFGHTLPQSFSGDLRIFRQGMGWLDGEHPDARDALVGSTARLNQEIPERFDAISRVAKKLTHDLALDEHGRYFNFDEAKVLLLSADEIAALIKNT